MAILWLEGEPDCCSQVVVLQGRLVIVADCPRVVRAYLQGHNTALVPHEGLEGGMSRQGLSANCVLPVSSTSLESMIDSSCAVKVPDCSRDSLKLREVYRPQSCTIVC